jgi:site-specific DNA-cytosine methylase
MNVLIGCEISGVVRETFRKAGHNAFSCDLQSSDSHYHIQMDVFFVVGQPQQFCGANKWDLIICHPPCTALCLAGNKYYGQGKPKHSERLKAIQWTGQLWDWARRWADCVCFENPQGVLCHSVMGKASQYIQPWQFGHPEKKKTGLWLSNLDNLVETTNVYEEMTKLPKKLQERNHYMSPSKDRGQLRSVTYQGIANAMVEQWG